MPAETYSMNGLRIRTPHKHDVLSGRGGGINMHAGNKVFREWVAERKEDYNLAPNKHEKTRIAMEVIEQVRNQSPPGRFLTRDPTSGSSQQWWVEVDENRALAKTSQALREGAPQIRLAHREELMERASQAKQKRSTAGTKRKRKPAQHTTRTSPTVPSMPVQRPFKRMSTDDYNRAMENLQANVREAKDLADQKARGQQDGKFWDPSTKRLRFEGISQVSPGNHDNDDDTNKLLDSLPETPSLLSLPNPPTISESYMDDLNLGTPAVNSSSQRRDPFQQAINSPAPSSFRNMPRVHSLALSDFSATDTNGVFDDDGKFVDPFEDESAIAKKVMRRNSSSTGLTERPFSTAEYLRNLSSNEDVNPEPHHVEPYHTDEYAQTESHGDFSNWLQDENHAFHGSWETDFGEGMKSILDIVHPDLTSPVKGEKLPTLLMPFRGSSSLGGSTPLKNNGIGRSSLSPLVSNGKQ